jgi:DNA end-binding protein Ku
VPDESELDVEELRARSFWSGTLTFGLVSVPVALFPANRPQRVSLRMLAPDGTPLRREYYDPRSNRKVTNDGIIRGYEMDEGEFVEVTDEELEGIEPEKTRDIDLRLFVPREQIDPVYFDRAYYLTPAGESTKAYKLLAETMERTGRAGIATFVMRAKEYLIAILAENGIMRAETLRFADEVRSADDVGLPAPVKVKPAARKKMEAAMKKLAAKKFDPEELVDRTTTRLLELIESKREAGVDVVDAAASDEPPDDVIDLMEVLKRSLSGGGGGGGAGSPKKAAPKKAASKTAANTPSKKSAPTKSASHRSSAKRASKKPTPKKSSPKKAAKKSSTRTRKAS